MQKRRLVSDLTQMGRQTRRQSSDFESGAPNVGSHFGQWTAILFNHNTQPVISITNQNQMSTKMKSSGHLLAGGFRFIDLCHNASTAVLARLLLLLLLLLLPLRGRFTLESWSGNAAVVRFRIGFAGRRGLMGRPSALIAAESALQGRTEQLMESTGRRRYQ